MSTVDTTNLEVTNIKAKDGTAAMSIADSTGVVSLTANPVLSGGGITFPATQVASSNANTLDDYEEGTWTPVPTNLTVVGTPSYTGTYTKIGNYVFCTARLSATTVSSTANSTYITGIPFTNGSANTVCVVSNQATQNIGCGLVYASATYSYLPSWVATANVDISFSLRV